MKLIILDKGYDNVIKADYFIAKVTLIDAYEGLVPLVNKFKEQRTVLKSNLYEKLKKDIVNGCIMPPLTIAFNQPELFDINQHSDGFELMENEIGENISKAFILDGIQRLTTIKKIKEEDFPIEFASDIYVNVIICDSMDKLVYRMITLNNGQKPMSARHQIEILADNILDFENLPIVVQSEKEQKLNRKAEFGFSKETIVKSYMAFISSSYNFDNQKIINDKLDELLSDNIMKTDIANRSFEFVEMIDQVNFRIHESLYLKNWFSVQNNLIGYCSAISKSYGHIRDLTSRDFENYLTKIESCYANINKSKIQMGQYRRKMVNMVIEKILQFIEEDPNEILQSISEL